MKNLPRIIFTTILACFLIISTVDAIQAQKRGHKQARPSPNASVGQAIGTTKISLTYGRPSVDGRKIFGGLVPYNKPWRAGANEATIIVLPEDIKIEGKPLEAGTYSFYTIPGKKHWSVVISSNLAWGIPIDSSKDIVRVQVEPETAPFREQLMIYFENVTNTSADIVLHWAKLKIPFSIKLQQ